MAATDSPTSPIVRGQTTPFPATPTSTLFIDAPPGQSYAEFLRTWTDEHVAQWLSEAKCSSLAPIFRANDIRGDILLELDQVVLKEMGVGSIGDRLRIVNAVKTLRQRVAARSTPTPSTRTTFDDDSLPAQPLSRSGSRRLAAGRPAPLQLAATNGRNGLPHLVRESGPDSARPLGSGIRPLPAPGSAASVQTPTSRQIPPLVPPPKGQPPPTPSARTPARTGGPATPSNGRKTPEPGPPLQTPSSATWHGQYHLPPNPRPRENNVPPSPATRTGPRAGPPNTGAPTAHGRQGSGGGSRPTHPFAGPPQPHPHNLSPIVEAFTNSNQQSSVTSPPGSSYAVGRGPFPQTPMTASAYANTPSLDDLRRKHVKFYLPSEMQSSSVTIDVSSCAGGVEVLEKVLKKVGRLVDGSTVQTSSGGLMIDGWAIVLDSEDPSQAEPLSDPEIMSICLAPPDHPARQRGLVLRQVRRYPPLSNTSKKAKRASTISVLSGLGVTEFDKTLEAPPSPTVVTPSPPPSPGPNSSKKGKLRNFFGQRPPSELITNHLAEYFPFTEKKVLERTARHSMMRFRRESGLSTSSANLNPPGSRFSSSTISSMPRTSMTASPRMSFSSRVSDDRTSEDIPRVSLSTDDGRSVDLDSSDAQSEIASTGHHHLLPPIPFPTDSLSESLSEYSASENSSSRKQRPLSTASKRMSFMTELRSRRDISDTASFMTVDEITANVESRGDEVEPSPPNKSEEQTLVDEDDTGDEEESETLNEGDQDEEEARPGVKIIQEEEEERKWIKGALIGAGSFGKVYLGMDASSGFLMAVKQVELPSGGAPNEARKKSMLTALEREIELLQDLQHENIVQYFYSSMDDEYLNIFLEYVPGGSVTALLSNYGAFEEPLVKNFVRQILQGLNYLHERDIIHRDIKGANILVDNKGGVKISDFGISKKVEDNLYGGGNRAHRPSLQGSVFWMAPEVVKQSGHTKKADIWSVGCLVVEMLTGEHPFATLNQMQAIFKIGMSAKPDIPSDISTDAQSFLAQTFEIDQHARPSADQLLQYKWLAVPKKPMFPSKAKAG